MRIKILLLSFGLMLGIVGFPLVANTQAASTCGGAIGSSNFVAWMPFGVVGLNYTNGFYLPTRFSDFTIVWSALAARAGAGVITLGRVTVGGTDPADPTTTVLWQGPDFAADTGGHTDGTWLTDYVFQPGESQMIYLDFDGTSTNLQAAFGAQISDINGTNFVIDPICPTGGSPESAPSFVDDGRINRRWGDHFAVVYPTDGAGHPALRIYRVDVNSRGWLALAVDLDDFPPVDDVHQLVAEGDGVAVYLLNTGEIDVYLGPDAEGKTYSVIIDHLPPTQIRLAS